MVYIRTRKRQIVFHRPGCPAARDIRPENEELKGNVVEASRDSLRNRRGCRICEPPGYGRIKCDRCGYSQWVEASRVEETICWNPREDCPGTMRPTGEWRNERGRSE